MLSNYYRKMRSEKPDSWIVKMDLVDHIGALHQFNLDEVDQKLEAIEFFIANIPHVKESPFAQSLLRHRLQTGDRIVVMLDGFDEINSHCQDKCIALIKAVRLTKLNAFYITTRPHLNEKLQDSLFQFAYTLRDFSQEDQINYLSRYWTKQLKVDDVLKVRSIATSIVDRLSKSLKGNQRSFIGIPLQCHIVADCFESQVNDIVQKGCNLEALLKDLDSNLNLDTLYERLFKKKREIYRQEKAKVQQVDNHILQKALEDHMECLEVYLRDLAVKTIVSDQTHIDCLLGKSSESSATIEQQHKKREEGSVCFGLLTLNRKGEYQFLHRTYAEYLMANYLYGGFRLDEDLRNKLLDEKPTRELIGSEILVGLQYQGVQLFIDCMLHEIVNHEKWHVTWRVQDDPNCNFPSQFTDFTNELYSVFIIQKGSANALIVAVERHHANIFELLCTFADVTLEKHKILELMRPLFKHVDSAMKFEFHLEMQLDSAKRKRNLLAFFWERKLDGFQRLLGWHDGKHADYTSLIAKAIYFYTPYLYIQDPQSEKDPEKQTEFLSQLLEFMLQNRSTVENYITYGHKQYRMFSQFENWYSVLTYFLRHEYYDSLLEPLVRLLLQTTSDSALVTLVMEAFGKHKDVFKLPKVEKLFNILIKMRRTDVLVQLPQEMIILAPKAFKFVYEYHQLCDRKKWLPENDSDATSKTLCFTMT
ncbi:hypothetical protein GHT06_014770 [Daphnia sinensis]|uniref:NACHT domain-containing protein n=1 Tax=Daphnia sinensis TaxID=1820382 RepID=A0AAD5PSN3_9CRUS|nr:hypothetical protein GHT06_014770 [Daphnia sinensis]